MGARILVVDDEETLRSVIGQVLTGDGHEVVEAACAEEALERFRQQPFPLVLTDIVMGKMSGLDLLREVKLLAPDSLVVIMTSHATLDTAVEALRAGAYDFLIKPFEDIELISSVVHRALDRIQLIQQNQDLLERLKDYTQRLEKMANRDGLTGLYNHRFFREALDAEFARSKRHERVFSLVFLDLDHFKEYNDNHGHLVGDALLRSLGQLLIETARNSDVVARYGGEEFVLLLPETDKAGAVRFADRVREALSARDFTDEDGKPIEQVTASFGVASFPEDAAETNKLIDRADQALYRAKQAGRDTVVGWSGADEPAAAPGATSESGGDGRG